VAVETCGTAPDAAKSQTAAIGATLAPLDIAHRPHRRGDQTVARRGTAAQIVATQRRRAVRWVLPR
jgi:hypothetical protein